MDLSNTTLTIFPYDPHSFSQPGICRIGHVDWNLQVDFEAKEIRGYGEYFLIHDQASEVILDISKISIKQITLNNEPDQVPFTFTAEKPHLGKGLRIPIRGNTQKVVIHFETNADAGALQWLAPNQTSGKVHPFVFSQSQAILARTWLPCQDSPAIRFTYTAQVKVPSHLLPLMSADNPQLKNETGSYVFTMDRPIPSYLLSLAVGDLQFNEIDARCGVYAEPNSLDKAIYEFADVGKMLKAAEEIYGPYLWGRYDLLLLPPSFPFGGMENPKLTFATPTIIAGDRSLTSLVAHELAHSWSGNLVTNATWNDFWLNEGFTVYFERRIMEHLYGKDYAEMLHTLGYQDLQQTLQELSNTPQDTCLKLNLTGRDPDEGLTEIAYEKGNFFLRHIENLVGRDRFDSFVSKYFSTFAFQSMDTERFVLFLEKELINGDAALAQNIQAGKWIYSPGLPEITPPTQPVLFDKVQAQLKKWAEGESANELETQNWSTQEWLFFLKSLPADISLLQMEELDRTYSFSDSGNSEILAEWLLLSVQRQYKPAYEALQQFLTQVGRRKFVMPLYKALLQTDEGSTLARQIYLLARPNYHAVTYSSVDQLLDKAQPV